MADFNFDDVHVPESEGVTPSVSSPPQAPNQGTASVDAPPGARDYVYQEPIAMSDGTFTKPYSGADYVPGKDNVMEAPPAPQEKVRVLVERGTVRDGDRIVEVDYIDRATRDGKLSIRAKLIDKIAKEIYASNVGTREKYQLALEIFEAADQDELDHPSEKLKNAVAIVEGGVPYTKPICERLARDQVYNQEKI